MTRTFKHLYPQIYDLNNLWLASRPAGRQAQVAVRRSRGDGAWRYHNESGGLTESVRRDMEMIRSIP